MSSEIELWMASRQGSLRHFENPTHIIYTCIFSPFELFVDVVFKYATLHYTKGGNEYFVYYKLFILEMYIHKPHFTDLSIRLFI